MSFDFPLWRIYVHLYVHVVHRVIYCIRILIANVKSWLSNNCLFSVYVLVRTVLTQKSNEVKPAILFSTADRRTSEHAFHFLRVLLVAVSICHSWLWQTWDDVYTQVFLRVRGNMLRCPRTKGTAVNEWVHSFVDFCLIPYPWPIPLTFQPQICKDGFISIVFDVSPECCRFDRVRADNRPVLQSLQRY